MINVTLEDQFVIISFDVDHVDSSNHKEFRELVRPYITEKAKIIFDLGALKFIDSSGLGAFLSVFRDLKSNKGDMNMYNPGDAVKILFDLVRLNKVIRVFRDRVSAEQALS
jgi:anti-sigma B factor antagonist